MRRHVVLIASVAALAGAAIAAADSIGTRALKPVSATFTATGVAKSSTRTCVGPSGSISATTLDVNGSAASADPALNGPVRVRLKSVVDPARQIGTVEGSLRFAIPGAPDTIARLEGVYSAGKLHGLLRGSAQRPFQRLLANVSADIGMSGLTNGKIGGTDGGGGALLLQPGRCQVASAQQVVATGLVSSVTETAITVAGITCSMTAEQHRRIGDAIRVGDRAKMTCRLEDGKLQLQKLARA